MRSRTGISTDRDVLQELCERTGITESQAKHFYRFFIDYIKAKSEDPEVLSIMLHKSLGTLYARSGLMNSLLYIWGKKELNERQKEIYNIYKKKYEVIESQPDYKNSINRKKFAIESPYLTKGLTKEEMEKKQNIAYDKETQSINKS